jgi:hypothetical protein
MSELLAAHRGSVTADSMENLCRDRATFPDTLSRALTDDDTSDVMTFASVIAEPALRQLRIAVGPPHEHAYHVYSFTTPADSSQRPGEALAIGNQWQQYQAGGSMARARSKPGA